MYWQGVSTRRISAVMEELFGLELTFTQVSRLTQVKPLNGVLGIFNRAYGHVNSWLLRLICN